MKRLAGVVLALLSILIAALAVAAKPDVNTQTINASLDGVHVIADGLTAHVVDVQVAKVPHLDASTLRYLVLVLEVTRTTNVTANVGATVTSSAGQTFQPGMWSTSPAPGFVTTVPVYFLMDIDAIPGARLELTRDTGYIKGGFQRVYSIDLGLTAERVASLDAAASVADKPLPTTTEAIR